ncbi:oxidoreductase [Campylobacter sp. MIT 99-7217]|uniref:hydrogenase small subunit n=1 Tax=Campylobacter sp. MIT 99-7217 TaxID=535091 RepID=UPI00115A1B59|nr:hydrogenase small subunit [Campylobacter sp. MIT 99-7217]TQR33668.1 oxidoreductase [Campylobacter sp. MIT 99-7217]
MADMSNDDLKIILQKRIQELESSSKQEPKTINVENLQNILKILALPSDFLPLASRVLELAPKQKVIWMHLCECTGCSESLFRTLAPDFIELVFDFISLEYHETIMTANGWQAEENLENTLDEDYILAVEGGVAAIDTYFLTIGAHGQSGYEGLVRAAQNAKAIFAMGTCSSYGGIQAARPNISKTCGISEVLTQKVINVPGCPPSDINIVANLIFYAIFGIAPNLDEKNRPKWAYGKCLHDMCERKAKFEAGIFANRFDDELAKTGACLFKIGCKGPYTYNNCPKVKFNAKTSWPVAAGHGCMACSEPNFWDDFGNYEEPMRNAFAYMDFSFKQDFKSFLPNLEQDFQSLNKNFKDENIVLNFTPQTQILYKKDGELIQNFLSFEFESNLKLILQNLAKNKIGASLVENYQKDFPQNYAFIQENFDEKQVISTDMTKLFELVYILAKGEFLKDKVEFLNLAASYKYKHSSPFDIKLSLNEQGAKLDVSKSLRMPLIYLCGGLDLEALAFSLVYALIQNLSQILSFMSKKENKTIVLNIDKSLNTGFLQESFSKHLQKN